jgi:nucleotide-binding universal stress UspA family protein
MFSTILVPLDGTAESNIALPVARTFARATGATITLLRVYSSDELRDDVQSKLARVADELATSNLEVHAVVRSGDAGAEILAQIEALHADVVVMRTHGRSGIGRMVLGSVTQRVLSKSRVPVVLVRPGGRRLDHIRKVLVPVDGSPGGAVGLAAAVALAEPTGAALYLLDVVTPSANFVYAGAAWNGGGYFDPAWDEEAQAAATTYVEGIRSRLTSRVPSVSGDVVVGSSVADAIVESASEQACDLIVMSSHALTGVARAVLGSVADAVVREADCPVLVIHAADQVAAASDAIP